MPEVIAQRVEPIIETEPVSIGVGKVEDKSVEQLEKPLELRKEPYLNEILNIGIAKDHFEMPALIKEIDEFIKSEIERKGLNGESGYKEIIEDYSKRLKIDGKDIYTKVELIAEVIRIDKKILDSIKEKEELMAKDITQLSSKQIEKRLSL